MTAVPKSQTMMSIDGMTHNIKRRFGDRGMLKQNSDELSNLYDDLGSLKKARSAQKAHWNNLPNQGLKIGAMTGVVINSGKDDDNITHGSMISKGVGSMKNGGRVGKTKTSGLGGI